MRQRRRFYTDREPVALGELAEALGAERTILTRNLSLIEGASWVEIQPAEDDARSRIVTVTDKGHAVVAGAFPAWRKAQDRGDWLGWRVRVARAGPAALH